MAELLLPHAASSFEQAALQGLRELLQQHLWPPLGITPETQDALQPFIYFQQFWRTGGHSPRLCDPSRTCSHPARRMKSSQRYSCLVFRLDEVAPPADSECEKCTALSARLEGAGLGSAASICAGGYLCCIGTGT